MAPKLGDVVSFFDEWRQERNNGRVIEPRLCTVPEAALRD
jgi:hypothetical protein